MWAKVCRPPCARCLNSRDPIAPTICPPFDGKVASGGALAGFVYTSPNMDWIPEYPVERQIVKTYRDGRFGLHEYSVWPQPHVELDMMHVACIPRAGAAPHLPRILWTSLQPEKHWAASDDIAVNGLGYLVPGVRKALERAAQIVIQDLPAMERIPAEVKRYGQFLVMVLRQCALRMGSIATVPSRAIAVAAHVQRLCLELAGLKTYLEVVVPRIESPDDFSQETLPVLGAFLNGDGADVQMWWKVGMPLWIVQPLSRKLVVWEVVSPRVAGALSSQECDPPILHSSGAFFGASNVTGNRLSAMVMAVSKHVAGTHLSRLSRPVGPNEASLVKSHLQMHPVDPGRTRGDASGAPKKATRRGKKHPKGPLSADTTNTTLGAAGAAVSASAPSLHPARTFLPSMLFDIPRPWASALASATPENDSTSASLYFYPPPFLLDCLALAEDIPEWVVHPENVRVDSKVDRYLHNLARIRLFCRSRLFDVTLTNHPLAIIEWRTALWGDYQPKTRAPQAKTGAVLRREMRRQGERNRTIDMFRQIARMDSYDPDSTATLGGTSITLETVKASPRVRRRLVWEAYEINFRADLMALDAAIVQTAEWQEIHKWDREATIARVWGEVSGMSVLPDMDGGQPGFLWLCPPDPRWELCQQPLQAFVDVLRRWPGAPDAVVQGLGATVSAERFTEVQNTAVRFYVDTFVHTFLRLPTPPVWAEGEW